MTTAAALSFDLWNSIDPETFLADDRPNPARRLAAEIVSAELASAGGKTLSMLEVGCGPGYDYIDYFQHMEHLLYSGIDGSSAMIRHLKSKFPRADFRVAGFDTVKRRKFDIVYAKAVLEHQPALLPALEQLLRGAKRTAIINWYLPPAEAACLQYSDSERMYYNRYKKSDVVECISKEGFTSEIIAAVGGNEVYVLRRE